LGKPFLQVDTFAMPNLVAGRRIVPELIQDDFTPERTAEEVLPLLTDPDRRAEMSAELFKVREQLGSPGATARAADTVLEVATSATSS
jgi:lipid-A-disaccharide synthase